jgi:hypothetical protein
MERGDVSAVKAQYNSEQKALNKKREEILELLKSERLDEKDSLRLTRVLQLADRYRPLRHDIKGQGEAFWLSYVKSLHRFLPIRRKSGLEKQNIKDYSAYSYVTAEKTVQALRALRHTNLRLENEPEFTEKEVVDQTRSGEVVKKETIDSSLTLDYEKKNWGPERICLDGIQNHLPSDSKGEKVLVRLQVGGEWVSLAEAKNNRNKVTAVRFIDDGVGFDVKNLDLLYSTKAGEEDSRGQFGEGMKMMAAAALRENLAPELESQNWRARPAPKAETLRDTRNNQDRVVNRLSFQVDHLAGQPMIGSRTTFWQPNQEFLNEVFQIEDKVLALREKYKPVFIGTKGQIVDLEPGRLFVKGIYVATKASIFSYNFDDVETNRDRNTITSEHIEDRVVDIVGEISSKTLAKRFLKQCLLQPNAIECNDRIEGKHPAVWQEAFYEAFGKDAVLDTGYDIPEIFKDHPINKIKFPAYVTRLLLQSGVKNEKEVIPDFYKETIATSLTADVGKGTWGAERVVLDGVQNHLPQDSGGTYLGLRFEAKDGSWHRYEDLANYKNEDIKALKVYDNGRGYDHRLLGLVYSDKDRTTSSGKFGEGLKMLSLACLRENMEIVLRSRNWTATPRFERTEIDGKQVDQLVYDVVHSVKDKDTGGDKEHASSSTTFNNPPLGLINEFRIANKKVLAIDRAQPMESTYQGDVLAVDQGLLYVRDILIPGNHNLAFSYHFPTFDIQSRDRNLIAESELQRSVAQVLSQVTQSEVIRSYLFKSNLSLRNESGGKINPNSVDFQAFFQPKNPEQWKKLFEETFGENTAIRDVQSQEYDAVGQNLHVGLEVVTFPTMVYNVLSQIGLPTYNDRIREMTRVDFVKEQDYTEEEREVMQILLALDEYLPNNRSSEIRLYVPQTPGQKVALGFSDQININLLRSLLSKENLHEAADVYYHEKTHHNTGAQDAAADFRNYLSAAAAQLALALLKRDKSEVIS